MSQRGSRFVLALLLAAFAAPVASAGPHKNAQLLLHAVPVETVKGATCFTGVPDTCLDVNTRGELEPQLYQVYLLITNFDTHEGVAGVQFGVSYDDSTGSGVDIDYWQSCALYEWPMENWPRSGTGNLLTWSHAHDCQGETPLPVGYFFVTAYSNDRFKITPRPVDGLARVARCSLGTADNLLIENLGWVDFGEGPGYNPCDPEQNLLNVQKRFKPIKD